MLTVFHRKAAADVEKYKKRVEQLETALQALQAQVSDKPHPLLNGNATPLLLEEDSIQASSGTNSTDASTPEESRDEVEAVLIDAFGTLTIGSKGEARYFGQTSRSEYLIHAPERLAAYDTPRLPRLTHITIDEANKEMDVFCRNDEVAEEILGCLPSISHAIHLCEIFFAYSKFLWYPVPKDYILREVIEATLFDLNMPPYAAEAHEYYLISRIALRWAPPTYDTTLASIQTLIYMSIYLEMSDVEPAHTGSHKAWMLIRQATAMGLSIGLHVSSSKWQLDAAAAAKRSRIFWQLMMYDTWLSFGFGRPPSMSMSFIDNEVPTEEDAIVNEEDRSEAGYLVWNWQFAKVMHSVMTTAFGAKPPTYAKIIELDRRVRDTHVPAPLQLPCGVNDGSTPCVTLTMQRMFVTAWREITLLNLHRPYFSVAVKEASGDPMKHKYAPSVLAVYRSAWRIISSLQSAHHIAPGIVSRCGFVWSHALASAILLCLLITHASSSNLSGPSLIELDKVCALFEEAASQSQFASNNLEAVRKLRKQAQAALSDVQVEDAAAIAAELDRLGGKTQLIQTIGERLVFCHSRARPVTNPPPSTFEVTNAFGGKALSTVANSAVESIQPFQFNPFGNPSNAIGYGTTRGNVFLPSGSGGPAQANMDNQPQPVVGLTQEDIAAIMDFDLANSVWDPSLGGSLQGVEMLQPDMGDAEATWQALVEQLGI
ncbi:hypothetical protein BN946_scf185013.g10 [Trametes cinnabarina]|uniref:Xylanolytic transcriptional activator regulatory domain-containing protein n=1 Tax=Pycnoporus cinnabarinus TaxID=5643 RepID=A0A060SGS7_PYCCI|nr:hypothetical protein BN946_scf185013.g10 [Trametes cinnabarina]